MTQDEDGAFALPPAVGVSCILRRIKGGLNRLGLIRIEGEIHSIKPYPSGHVYLDLKDNEDDAILHCVVWRRNAYRLKRLPEQGESVVLTGTLDVFEVRGQLQFNVVAVQAAGDGALFAKFEALKRKLLAEGLFDATLKKELPRYPQSVGVITSTETAALQDVMKTRASLAPWVPFVVYHAGVQGEASEGEILAALKKARERNEVDVLLLVRGGGSLADLWSFNSEALARELRAMPMPVVTGIGHETDFTIADMAADVRAPTPTAACSLVLQHWSTAPQWLSTLETRLATVMQANLRLSRSQLTQAVRLQSAMQNVVLRLRTRVPAQRELRQIYERYLDALTERLDRNAMTLATERRVCLQAAASKTALAQMNLLRVRPAFDKTRAETAHLEKSLRQAVSLRIEAKRAELERLSASLSALDITKTLARGFSLTTDSLGRPVRDAEQLAEGETVSILFEKGSARARVIERIPRS